MNAKINNNINNNSSVHPNRRERERDKSVSIDKECPWMSGHSAVAKWLVSISNWMRVFNWFPSIEMWRHFDFSSFLSKPKCLIYVQPIKMLRYRSAGRTKFIAILQNKLKSNKNISAYYSVYKVPSSQRGTIQHLTIEKDCRNNKRQIDFRSSTEKIKSTKGNGTKEEDWMGPFFFQQSLVFRNSHSAARWWCLTENCCVSCRGVFLFF